MRSELERVLDKLLLEASGASTGTTKYLDVDGQEYEVTIAELISNGADPNIYHVEDGLTPIMGCALVQNLEGYKILADISDFRNQSADGSTILHNAIEGESYEIIDDIISRAPWIVNITNSRNETPIMLAVNCGRENALEMLLRAGVDPNSYSKYEGMEMCILAHAISCGQMNMVKLLIQHGAWVEHVIYDDEYQQNDDTLLEWCVIRNQKSAINSIVSCLSHIAERPDHADLACILRDLEINPKIRQSLNKENTAMIAVLLGEGDLIIDEYKKRLEESGSVEEAFSEEEKKLIDDLRQFKEKLRDGLELLQENPADMPSEIAISMVMIDLTKDVMEAENEEWRESCFSNKYPEFSRAQSEVVNNYIENFKNPSKESKVPSSIAGKPSFNSGKGSCIVM